MFLLLSVGRLGYLKMRFSITADAVCKRFCVVSSHSYIISLWNKAAEVSTDKLTRMEFLATGKSE